MEDRLLEDRITKDKRNRNENTKREKKQEEDRREKLAIVILGIMVMLESVQIHKGKNRGKQRTKKAREKRRQKRDIRENEYIETTPEAKLEKIWQEEKHRQAERTSGARQWKKRGIKKERRMGKRWKKGKYRKEVTQEKGKAGLARGRWEEKLLKRTKEEREKENKKREGEIDG
jgi:hypothetical protein